MEMRIEEIEMRDLDRNRKKTTKSSVCFTSHIMKEIKKKKNEYKT